MEFKQFATVEFGGPIGLKREHKVFCGADGWGGIIETFDDKDDAKAYTKDMQKGRSDVDKNYYMYKYKTVKLTEKMLEDLKQQK